MTTIVHDEPFTVTGSGFGTKTGSAPDLYDNCSHGNAILAASGGFYSRQWHDPGELGIEAYRDPTTYPSGNGVALPHDRITKVICGAHIGSGINSSDVWVTKDYERPSGSDSWWSVLVYYFRVNHDWEHLLGDPADSNFKQHFVCNGGRYPAQGTYAYIEYENSTWVDGTQHSGAISWHDAGVIGSSPQFNNVGTRSYNPQEGWLKVENVINYNVNSTGLWKWRVNQQQQTNLSFRTHTAAAGYDGGSTIWQETIGGFSRDRGNANNVRYFADIYRDVQLSNPGRFYLTNHATWGSETIAEIQPWTSWSDTSVTMTCKAGAHPNGTLHVQYRNEVNGNQYLGTVTLGDEGGGGTDPSPVMPRPRRMIGMVPVR